MGTLCLNRNVMSKVQQIADIEKKNDVIFWECFVKNIDPLAAASISFLFFKETWQFCVHLYFQSDANNEINK